MRIYGTIALFFWLGKIQTRLALAQRPHVIPSPPVTFHIIFVPPFLDLLIHLCGLTKYLHSFVPERSWQPSCSHSRHDGRLTTEDGSEGEVFRTTRGYSTSFFTPTSPQCTCPSHMLECQEQIRYNSIKVTHCNTKGIMVQRPVVTRWECMKLGDSNSPYLLAGHDVSRRI